LAKLIEKYCVFP